MSTWSNVNYVARRVLMLKRFLYRIEAHLITVKNMENSKKNDEWPSWQYWLLVRFWYLVVVLFVYAQSYVHAFSLPITPGLFDASLFTIKSLIMQIYGSWVLNTGLVAIIFIYFLCDKYLEFIIRKYRCYFACSLGITFLCIFFGVFGLLRMAVLISALSLAFLPIPQDKSNTSTNLFRLWVPCSLLLISLMYTIFNKTYEREFASLPEYYMTVGPSEKSLRYKMIWKDARDSFWLNCDSGNPYIYSESGLQIELNQNKKRRRIFENYCPRSSN